MENAAIVGSVRCGGRKRRLGKSVPFCAAISLYDCGSFSPPLETHCARAKEVVKRCMLLIWIVKKFPLAPGLNGSKMCRREADASQSCVRTTTAS
jgi:hypothetical protein